MRVLAVGNMYPPHHLGGYELVWRSAMRYIRGEGVRGRVRATLELPGQALVDLVEIGVLLRGSLRYRTLVL